MPVIARADKIQVETKAVQMHLLCAGQRQTAAGRVRRIVDVERFAAAVP